MKSWFPLISLALTLGSCATMPFSPGGINEIPMYGQHEPTSQQREADDRLIQAVLDAGRTRADASAAALEQGHNALGRGEWGPAVRKFNEAWVLAPASADVYAAFAFWYVKQKNYGQAESMYLVALEKDPQHKIALHDLGLAYYVQAVDVKYTRSAQSKEWFRKSIDVLKKCIALYPEWGKPYRTISSTYMQIGDFATALTYAEKAQALNVRLEKGYLDYLRSQRDRL